MMFLETAMFDTFISDNDTWDAVESNMRLIYREKNFLRKFQMRREVVRSFFKYCELGVERLVESARTRNLPPQWCANPMSRVAGHFRDDLTRAAASASRNYGPSAQSDGLPLFTPPERSASQEEKQDKAVTK